MKFGSDIMVDAIKSMGIKYAPLNPGASIRGLHDSIVNYGGNKEPELILCCHEEIAVAIAAGYFRASGEPLAVLLHDLEGLFHATKAIYDAWLQRDAVLLLGGNGPVDIEKRRPWIDWIHTALVPNLLVREYVKWDDQPQGLRSTIEALYRAYRIATTEPKGPVYISIDAALQEEALDGDGFELPRLEDYSPLSLGEGSLEALGKAAQLLIDAERPVVLVDRYGRGDESVAQLVKLVELLGAPVLDSGLRFNFPTNHPQNLSFAEEEVLKEADVVLALDVKDLYHALVKPESHFVRRARYMVRSDCRVIRIDLEGAPIRSWVQEQGRLAPSSLSIHAYAPAAVERLLELLGEMMKGDAKRRAEERAAKMREVHEGMKRSWIEEAQGALRERPIASSALALMSWELVKGYDWVLAFPGYQARGINAWIRRIWEIGESYRYPGRGGGTGTGIGRAIGVALAHKGKGRLCIDFNPDGDLLYAASSLWTAAHHRIPLLIIVLNNRSYFNDEEHQKAVALERQRPVENRVIGIRLEDPNIDFARLAEGYGLVGLGPYEDVQALREGMAQGIRAVLEEGRPCLIDALVKPR